MACLVCFSSQRRLPLFGLRLSSRAFDQLNYPSWFMYVTAVVELAGGILVLLPRYAALGAALISCVMIGALLSLFTHGMASDAPPPAVLLVWRSSSVAARLAQSVYSAQETHRKRTRRYARHSHIFIARASHRGRVSRIRSYRYGYLVRAKAPAGWALAVVDLSLALREAGRDDEHRVSRALLEFADRSARPNRGWPTKSNAPVKAPWSLARQSLRPSTTLPYSRSTSRRASCAMSAGPFAPRRGTPRIARASRRPGSLASSTSSPNPVCKDLPWKRP